MRYPVRVIASASALVIGLHTPGSVGALAA